MFVPDCSTLSASGESGHSGGALRREPKVLEQCRSSSPVPAFLRTWLYLVTYRFQSFRTRRVLVLLLVCQCHIQTFAKVACQSVESRSNFHICQVQFQAQGTRFGLTGSTWSKELDKNTLGVKKVPADPDLNHWHFEWVYTGFFLNSESIIRGKSLLWLLSFKYPWNLGMTCQCLRGSMPLGHCTATRATLTSVFAINSRELGIISMGLRPVRIGIGESFIHL